MTPYIVEASTYPPPAAGEAGIPTRTRTFLFLLTLDAELSYDLLLSIFNTASPLHDGAVVVRRHRIAAASCFLPLTLNPRLSRDLGTRHRAAIGVTEDTDAVAVVVSEETGLLSFVQRGEIKRGLDATKLREAIFETLGVLPKKEKEVQKTADQDAEEIAPV